MRRRIDRRIRATTSEARRLVSWRTYVKRYPGHALAAAFGVGLTASAGLKPGRILRWLTTRLLRKTSEQIGRQLCNELKQIWADWRPGRSAAEDTGADDDHA